jgi:CelD/BcsL family acetyltransferase involved in cellulose biosynthesis
VATTKILSPYVPLEATFEAYFRGRSRNFRKSFKARVSRLRKTGHHALRCYDTPREMLAHLDDAVQVNLCSSKRAKFGFVYFLNRRNVQFHRDLLKDLEEGGHACLSVLELEGRPICYSINYIHKDGMFHTYHTSFRDDYSRYAPGRVHDCHIIEECYRRGLREYNFGLCTDEYKQSFTERNREIVSFWAYKKNPVSLFLGFAEFLAGPAFRKIFERIRRPLSSLSSR